MNNIHYLAKVDPDKTQEAIYSLSNLLRYTLYESNEQLISVKKEFAFMKSYVELMRMRYSPEQVKVTVDIPSDNKEFKVAPLLFTTLIENAFKHGISPVKPSFININIDIAHNDNGDRLICDVSNSYFPKNKANTDSSGIGLDNLRKRLMLIYPGQHIFAEKRDDTVYNIHLELTLKQ